MAKLFHEQLTQYLGFMGQIPSSNHTNNTDTSVAGIDSSRFRRIITLLDIGVNGGGNIQLYYQASASANMASPTNVAAAIPLTVTVSNVVATLEVRADQLPNGTRWVQPVMIVNSGASNVGLIALGGDAEYSPGNQYNLTTVTNSTLQAVT